MGSLIPRLSWRIWQFALLVISVKGILLQPLLYSLSSTFRLPLTLLSINQFFSEWLVLAVAVALPGEGLTGRACVRPALLRENEILKKTLEKGCSLRTFITAWR